MKHKAAFLKSPDPAQNGAAVWVNAGFFFFTLFYLEVVLQIVVFRKAGENFLYTAGFDLVFACAMALITSFLPKKANFAVTALITGLLILLFGSQVVYYYVFGTLYSVGQMQMGGAAITSFWRETISTMADNIPTLLILLVPVLVLILLRLYRKKVFAPARMPWRLSLIAVAVLAQLACTLCLNNGDTGFYTNYYFYHSDSTTTDQAASRFGLLTAFRLDIMGAGEDDQDEPGYYIPSETTVPEVTEETAPLPSEDVTAPPTEPLPEPEYNVFTIDFDQLNALTTNEKLLALNQYCSSIPGTQKNAYTGMLSGYNLIYICAESFSTAAIHPEVTPTLYKMANEGFLFTNFYNSFPNKTIDGEYSLNFGLFPDTSRGKAGSSFLYSRLSYLPFCLGNVFKEQYGMQAYGYHNNVMDYYSRGASHKNLGYQMKFANAGMTFSAEAWPASDLEMLEQSVDDYINQDIFCAYYMTFSGHYKYDINVNGIARQNWDVVKDLPYSDPCKAYLSCHVELDKAMEYLLNRLEEAGIADRTAIVMVGDHFPYGLTDEEYSELIGYQIDDFSKYKSTAMFWVGGMEEAVVVDEYCCNIDILPTVLNLWGFDFDSRLLVGTDIFSNSPHVAIRIDKGFYTDKVWFNTNTGEIRYLVDESELPENYIEDIIRSIETKFSVSKDILNELYYNFVFEQGAEYVIRSSEEAATEPPQ